MSAHFEEEWKIFNQTQSEPIDPVSPQAAQLVIHFFLFISLHTIRGLHPFEGPDQK